MSEDIAAERNYTIPLRDAWNVPRKNRARRAVNLLKKFALRHMKAKRVQVSTGVNEVIWDRSAQNPPRRISVLLRKDKEDTVTIMLPEEVAQEKEDSKEEETE